MNAENTAHFGTQLTKVQLARPYGFGNILYVFILVETEYTFSYYILKSIIFNILKGLYNIIM